MVVKKYNMELTWEQIMKMRLVLERFQDWCVEADGGRYAHFAADAQALNEALPDDEEMDFVFVTGES